MERLTEWKENLISSFDYESENNLLNELSKEIKKFNIPKEPFFDLIDGMKNDLQKDRYNTFDELRNYCYSVASTVGLMTIPIFGYKEKSTVNYAIDLGIALQLTNIIRDVKSDALRGRIYLPLEDLRKYNYTEKELFEFTYNENFIELLKFESDRARSFYRSADNYLSSTDKPSMFPARAMQYIYYRLLDKIEQENYNVFKKKIRVSNFNKLFIAISVYLKYKIMPNG